jgi:hypothetical protein
MEISGGTGTARDGDFAMKVVGHRYEVTMEAAVSHFQNAMSVTVDGECNVYCRSNANVQVDGNLIVDVGGNMTTRVKGNWDLEVDGNATANIGGNWENSAGGNFTVAAGGVITESAGGTFSMTSGAQIAEDAPDIWLNSGHSSSVSPVAPQVPPFPAALDKWTETRNQSGPDPVKETNPDPNPQNYSQQDC